MITIKSSNSNNHFRNPLASGIADNVSGRHVNMRTRCKLVEGRGAPRRYQLVRS
jgi:hypothetical protein